MDNELLLSMLEEVEAADEAGQAASAALLSSNPPLYATEAMAPSIH